MYLVPTGAVVSIGNNAVELLLGPVHDYALGYVLIDAH
jgi:hypothetical protein